MYKKIGRFKFYGFFAVIFALNFYAAAGEATAIAVADDAEGAFKEKRKTCLKFLIFSQKLEFSLP